MRNMMLVIAFGASVVATAAVQSPLLVKDTGNGPLAPPYHFWSRCEVYTDKVVTTNHAGAVVSVISVPLSLSNSVEKVIADASIGQVSSKQGPLGSGVTTWTALTASPSGDVKSIVLQSAGSMVATNDAPAAQTLINFLDLTCK